MMKKLVLCLLLMFCVTASAYAAKNDVHPFTEIPPIVKGICSQAGSLTLTFENATVFNATTAEIIGRLSPGVTLCQPIDMYVRIADGTNTVAAPRTVGVVQQQFIANGVAGRDVVFRVTGSKGSDEVIIVPLNGTLQANNTGMKFVLFNSENSTGELLDASLVNYDVVNGRFLNATDGSVLAGAALTSNPAIQVKAVDNSLCVLTPPDYNSDEVRIYLESAPKTYTFSPADSVIAIVGSKSISVVPAKKPTMTALVPTAGHQGTASGCDKSYEDGKGMCESYDSGLFGHYAVETGSSFLPGVYEMEMELLVNGAGGDKGAYFADLPHGPQLGKAKAFLTGSFAETVALTDVKKFLGTGEVTMAAPTSGCTRADDQKITRITAAIRLEPAHVKGMKVWRFSVPTISVPGLAAGDVVSLKVTLRFGRCQVVYGGSRNLFTMVDTCSSTATPGVLFFPYFAGSDDGYWNGFALVNSDAGEVNASLTIVEQDGKKGSLNVTVPAEGMVVKLVEKLHEEAGFDGSAKGKGRSYMTVESTGGSLRGFAMMANDKGESMGYVVP